MLEDYQFFSCTESVIYLVKKVINKEEYKKYR